ncbi:predicted protein [Nematostella vectensis]|uniref:G-protein coupled receptors family 1 profile domain-containing protein n=1 Tax=Nematostella vectensis TaxID=45351 RepID=A7RG34_NEMVE|nr:melanopsin [Nematostella vectensis]EDO49350.1 predicted protein [Nematostella vectensis]|eukprot:XP_001641413.1 predicted protein [Nematostella vectensis]
MEGHNSSTEIIPYNSHSLPLAIINFLLSTGASLSNGLLIVAIIFDPYNDLRTPSAMLVTNLAITDLLNSLIAGYGTFIYDVFKYKNWAFNRTALLAIIVTSALAIVCGTWCMLLMLADRYVAILHPLVYRVRVTHARVKLAIALSWVYSLVFNSLPILGVSKQLYGFISSHLHVTIPALIIGTVYPRLILIFRSRPATLRTVLGGDGADRAPRGVRPGPRRDGKFTSAILTLIVCFYVSFIPYFIALNIIYLYPHGENIVSLQVFVEVGFVVLLSSGLLNPIVYALRVPKYRKAIKAILGVTRNVVLPSSAESSL